MTIVDANVLLYAVNSATHQHRQARRWLDRALSSGEPIGMPWLVLLAFLRIATHPAIFDRPLERGQALSLVDAWCQVPSVVHPQPTARFLAVLSEAMARAGVAGNLVNDAYLAALASAYDARVATFDGHFRRFGVPVITPEEPAS